MDSDNSKEKQEPFQNDKWLYYQDVIPTGKKVEPTDKDKENVEKWIKHICEEIEKNKNL